MTTQEILESAIKQKKAVHLNFGGDPRQVCPHALGTNNSGLHVLVYQYSGRSARGRLVPGSPDNWRCMSLDKITDIEIVDDEWKTSYNKERPSTCLDSVICEVVD